jgi:NAD(P)-dependent dehydrogenase (short-subunit alcohol dehydrogenase family)
VKTATLVRIFAKSFLFRAELKTAKGLRRDSVVLLDRWLFAPLAETTADAYRRVFDVNVLGTVWGLKHEVPALLLTGAGDDGSLDHRETPTRVSRSQIRAARVHNDDNHNVLGRRRPRGRLVGDRQDRGRIDRHAPSRVMIL